MSGLQRGAGRQEAIGSTPLLSRSAEIDGCGSTGPGEDQELGCSAPGSASRDPHSRAVPLGARSAQRRGDGGGRSRPGERPGGRWRTWSSAVVPARDRVSRRLAEAAGPCRGLRCARCKTWRAHRWKRIHPSSRTWSPGCTALSSSCSSTDLLWTRVLEHRQRLLASERQRPGGRIEDQYRPGP